MNGFGLQKMTRTERTDAHSEVLFERYFKLGEVQKMLSVSRSTVWRWHAERGLKVVTVGAVTRIRESDLEEFLARHESSSLLRPDAEASACAHAFPTR